MIGFGLSSNGQGDLLITPTRVVFEGSKQKEELNLVNLGADTAVYVLSFVQYNMKEDGSFIKVKKTDTGNMFADPYLRIYPRRVTLAPREPQMIQVQFRRKAGMADGEYRSHLYFRAEKETAPQRVGNDTSTLMVNLIPVFGLSIPVIIRTGEVQVSVSLSSLAIEYHNDTIPFLHFNINRSGNISIFGDFEVEYLPENGPSSQIGLLRGVGVYTNITNRFLSLRLSPPPGITLKGGTIRLTYYQTIENRRTKYIAEQDLRL
jgi:P pilus assembly chaperone PapD